MGMLKVVSQQSWLTTFNIPICNNLTSHLEKGINRENTAQTDLR